MRLTKKVISELQTILNESDPLDIDIDEVRLKISDSIHTDCCDCKHDKICTKIWRRTGSDEGCISMSLYLDMKRKKKLKEIEKL